MNKILSLFIFLQIGLISCYAEGIQSIDYETTSTNQEDSQSSPAIRYGIHTNTLSWIALTPHLEFDLFLKNHFSISAGGAYGWWGFKGDQHAAQSWKIAAESRYYFKPETYTANALGLRLETGQFDVRLNDYGRRGELTTLGLIYAYTWHLGKKQMWYLDLGIGGGFIHTDYTKYIPYEPTKCYHRIYDKTKNTLGLTNLFFNISYRFPLNKKKGGVL